VSPDQRQALHQWRGYSYIVVCLNDFMNMVRHRAAAEHFQLITLLPLPEVRRVVLEITAFDEHRLAVMAALDNMMAKPGTMPLACLGIILHAFEAQNPFCANSRR